MLLLKVRSFSDISSLFHPRFLLLLLQTRISFLKRRKSPYSVDSRCAGNMTPKAYGESAEQLAPIVQAVPEVFRCFSTQCSFLPVYLVFNILFWQILTALTY